MTESFLDCGVTFILSCPPEALLKRTQELEAAKSEELQEVKGDPLIICKQCGRDFLSSAKLRSHQKYGCTSSKNDSARSLYGEKCKQELNSTSDEDTNFPLAKAPVNEKHMFVCVVCTAEFMGIRNFIDHIKDHEKNIGEWSDGCSNEFKFDGFPNTFPKEADQEGEEKMHTYNPPKPHVCGICGKRFRFKVIDHFLAKFVVNSFVKRVACAFITRSTQTKIDSFVIFVIEVFRLSPV
ncbi:unnamed protein product [Allacma fusca]|uniref:C2H2-type domain-containing protein n=1 Tax=Allacma fusca TaxID=39272 RepID=A0A8J2L0N1_9HEXA|nr:unnamed protein product [Allacma fusca]